MSLGIEKDFYLPFWAADEFSRQLEAYNGLPYRVDGIDWTTCNYIVCTKFTVIVSGTSIAAMRSVMDVISLWS